MIVGRKGNAPIFNGSLGALTSQPGGKASTLWEIKQAREREAALGCPGGGS